MTDRPILFSAPMILVLLAGQKTQTRRVLKPPYGTLEYIGGKEQWRPIVTRVFKGDRLWVREAWRAHWEEDEIPPRHLMQGDRVHYEADGPPAEGSRFGKLRPSMFMPRWASRLTLDVTDVRVERLQDISEEDAIAEGIERTRDPVDKWKNYQPKAWLADWASATNSYMTLWNSINGPSAWQADPWVAVYTFTVHNCNIDAMKEAA